MPNLQSLHPPPAGLARAGKGRIAFGSEQRWWLKHPRKLSSTRQETAARAALPIVSLSSRRPLCQLELPAAKLSSRFRQVRIRRRTDSKTSVRVFPVSRRAERTQSRERGRDESSNLLQQSDEREKRFLPDCGQISLV